MSSDSQFPLNAQRVKIVLGDIGVDGGDLAADNPLPSSDGGSAYTSSLGVGGHAVTSSNANAAPLVITDSPTAGQKIVLDDLVLCADTAMLVTLRTTTDHLTMGRYLLPAGGPPCQLTTRGKLKAPTANETLELFASVPGNIYVQSLWHSEA